MSETAAPPAGLHRELGLTDEEFEAIRSRLGREPTHTELAMFSVMWSEHCSYKSSRLHLRNLPTQGPHILVGPGEGAGVVEVAPGIAVAWKIESHNHPSYVEPFNGAATGVGGIVRDVLSMGARPVALLDSLRFGPMEEARDRYIVDGVVGGISSYGNSIGVPTLGGETAFEDCYTHNPLVNAACLGVVEERLMQARAEGPGNIAVLFGGSTGRDGIGGASVLASATFDDASLAKRPSVQVGDPFAEKLLIEATLELIRRGLVVSLQDLGAGGISCPASEMAAKAGAGIRIDADKVHLREPGMEPFEIMISESQERMFAVVAPGHLEDVLAVCAKWGLEATTIGEVTTDGRLQVVSGGELVADASAAALAGGPLYRRPAARPQWLDELQASPPGDGPPSDLERAFLSLLSSPEVASKRWVWQQYDHMMFLGTIQGPGGDAAVMRLPGTDVAVALALDGPGRYCQLDPYEGARLAVAEAARNVACAGAKPLAVTNCLNFGNPENPEVMWQFAEAVRGIADACAALQTPVTGGNVSFYNETNGRAIFPTPVIGMLGVLPSPASSVSHAFQADEDVIALVGATDPRDFGGSEYAKVINGVIGGMPPHLDLTSERKLQEFLLQASSRGLLHSAHDPSGGGLAIALAESAIAGGRGFRLHSRQDFDHRMLFSESPSRAVVSFSADVAQDVFSLAGDLRILIREIGTSGGDLLGFGAFSVPLGAAAEAYERVLPERLSASMG